VWFEEVFFTSLEFDGGSDFKGLLEQVSVSAVSPSAMTSGLWVSSSL
jgi:hypothetical protein